VEGLTAQAVEALEGRLEGRGLPPELAERLQVLAGPTQVGKVVESDAFADAWVHANRLALPIRAVIPASLGLAFWGHPTGKVVIGLAVALLIAPAFTEFLARAPQPAPTTGNPGSQT
jgi:hypothetical protein